MLLPLAAVVSIATVFRVIPWQYAGPLAHGRAGMLLVHVFRDLCGLFQQRQYQRMSACDVFRRRSAHVRDHELMFVVPGDVGETQHIGQILAPDQCVMEQRHV